MIFLKVGLVKPAVRLVAWVLLFVGAGALCSAGANNDWLIVPGERAGPVTARTTRAELVRLFGAQNVEDANVTVGDEVDPGTVVMKGQPEASFSVEWNDDEPEAHIYSLHFCTEAPASTQCRWHTESGITTGTRLKALEKLNGGKFKLLGFDWDWEGTVMSWNGGKMQKFSRGCLGMRLLPRPGQAGTGEKRDLYDEVSGDKEFWSSDPAMQTINPAVMFLSLAFGAACRN